MDPDKVRIVFEHHLRLLTRQNRTLERLASEESGVLCLVIVKLLPFEFISYCSWVDNVEPLNVFYFGS